MNRKEISVLLLVFVLFPVYQTHAQIQDQNNAIHLSDDFDANLGRLVFYAENRDFCDYYLYISFVNAEGFSGMAAGVYVPVFPAGKKQILNYRVETGATRYSYNYHYAMYRGDVGKKPNVDFIYSLPVADKEAVTARIAENQDGYQLAFGLTSDTVYACRGGVMCDDNLKDNTSKGRHFFNSNRNLSQITVYHADGSFGEYVFKGKSLVYSGQKVKTGSPIAIVERRGNESLRFSVYFLDKNKLKNNTIGNKHTHFRPFFQTANEGKTRLENGRTYLCEYTNEMLMQEMSKREKKNFLKKNLQQ